MIKLSDQDIFKCMSSKISFNYFLSMLFLISYKFFDAISQEKGAKLLTEW